MKKTVFILMILAITVGSAASALAEMAKPEFEFYGSARMETFSVHTDNGSSDTDLLWDLQGNSRLGFKAKVGDIAGRVELGTGVNLRVLYATYDFGPATLKIGQDWTPTGWYSQQVVDEDLNFIGFGALYDGRQPYIELTSENGFSAALIKPNSATISDVNGNTLGDGTADGEGLDTILPKIVLGYTGGSDNHSVGAVAAFNAYDVTEGTFDETIDSWLISLRGKSVFGDADFTWTGHYGQNLQQYGITYRREAGANVQVTATGDVEDSESFGGWAQFGYDARVARINLGAAYTESDNDLYAKADNQASYFVNAIVPIAKTFFVVPEISYFDLMDAADGSDEGDETWIGAKWQMDF